MLRLPSISAGGRDQYCYLGCLVWHDVMLLGRPTPTALTYPGLTRRILKPWSRMASVTLLISTLETILDMSLSQAVKYVLVVVVAM